MIGRLLCVSLLLKESEGVVRAALSCRRAEWLNELLGDVSPGQLHCAVVTS